MIALAWLSLITMLLLSLVHLQTVMSFQGISPLPRTNTPGIRQQQISQRENILQPKYKSVMKGQRQEKSTALGIGAFGGGGAKKSPGGFGGGGGKSAFGGGGGGKSAFG